MKTITIQISNSDDKLSQARWASFVGLVQKTIDIHSEHIHFAGGSPSHSIWQNFCWVLVCHDLLEEKKLKYSIATLRCRYLQDSAAWTEGETEFI